MLKIEKLNQFYGESHTLWELELDVPKGQCTCVMGRNGVGKTTLMKCVMGEETTSSGSIQFDGGTELTKQKLEERSRLGIGYVPQGRQIFPLLTVEENLRTGLAVRKDGSKKIPERIYELFPVLKDMLGRRGGDFSGGQQQQLAIGRALVMRPSLLVLDEPTEGIQPSIIKDIGRAILFLRDRGDMAILLVEQYFDFARDLADDFAVMDRGEIVLSGTKAELVESEVRRYLTV
jgi:urea transport system ATP-binding protein